MTAMQRIRDRLDELGKNQKQLAAHLTARMGKNVGDGRISDILNGKKPFKTTELSHVANFLEWTPAQLLDVIASAVLPSGDAKPLPIQGEHLKENLPVKEVADIGGGCFTLGDNRATTDRPATLEGVPNAFGFRVENETHPAYERGVLVYVDPTLPAAGGDNALMSGAGPDGRLRYTIRKILEVTETHWKVKDYKNDRMVSMNRAEWPAAHKIVGTRSR